MSDLSKLPQSSSTFDILRMAIIVDTVFTIIFINRPMDWKTEVFVYCAAVTAIVINTVPIIAWLIWIFYSISLNLILYFALQPVIVPKRSILSFECDTRTTKRLQSFDIKHIFLFHHEGGGERKGSKVFILHAAFQKSGEFECGRFRRHGYC